MSSFPLRLIGSSCILALTATIAAAADQARPTAQAPKSGTSSSTTAAARPGAPRTGAKGPLPDPVLLDGSTQPAEKKSEHGMIGEFELPGDENARSGKVGGPQNPNGQQPGISVNLPGLPLPIALPSGASGAPGAPGGVGLPALPGGAQSAAGGLQLPQPQLPGLGGPQNPAAAGNPLPGGGDAGAQPQGTQVAELGGEASGQSGADGGLGEKPKQVAIGDSAMRIEQSANIPGVVGAQQQVAGQTQQHEKGTGSGGKGTGGASSGNRAEKGRAIPAGL